MYCDAICFSRVLNSSASILVPVSRRLEMCFRGLFKGTVSFVWSIVAVHYSHHWMFVCVAAGLNKLNLAYCSLMSLTFWPLEGVMTTQGSLTVWLISCLLSWMEWKDWQVHRMLTRIPEFYSNSLSFLSFDLLHGLSLLICASGWLTYVTLDHKTSLKCTFFKNCDLYITWKLNN